MSVALRFPSAIRCKNCQIHVNRDVHLDLTPLKKRLVTSDVTRLTYVVQFVDRTATKVRD